MWGTAGLRTPTRYSLRNKNKKILHKPELERTLTISETSVPGAPARCGRPWAGLPRGRPSPQHRPGPAQPPTGLAGNETPGRAPQGSSESQRSRAAPWGESGEALRSSAERSKAKAASPVSSPAARTGGVRLLLAPLIGCRCSPTASFLAFDWPGSSCSAR